MIRTDRGRQQTFVALVGAVVLGSIALVAATPSTSTAQEWDYDYYDGAYGPMGYGWYYDSYNYEPSGFGTDDWRWKSDAELKEDVQSELYWSPFMDSDDISVSVKNGEVTLKGTVEDESEIDDAIENAYEAGAKNVVSKLRTEEDDSESS
jgi:hypothetical protein